ncbi:MAG: hypothetical protein ACNA7G_13130 [Methylobacter sp.]
MDNWIERRKGYCYKGALFSEDGRKLKYLNLDYREKPFSSAANKRFNIWLAVALLFVFPGMPLLAYWGLNKHLLWIWAVFAVVIYRSHGKIHACPHCGLKSRVLDTPHIGAPVLYLCSRCRTFFEHGAIDGGLPWK